MGHYRVSYFKKKLLHKVDKDSCLQTTGGKTVKWLSCGMCKYNEDFNPVLKSDVSVRLGNLYQVPEPENKFIKQIKWYDIMSLNLIFLKYYLILKHDFKILATAYLSVKLLYVHNILSL